MVKCSTSVLSVLAGWQHSREGNCMPTISLSSKVTQGREDSGRLKSGSGGATDMCAWMVSELKKEASGSLPREPHPPRRGRWARAAAGSAAFPSLQWRDHSLPVTAAKCLLPIDSDTEMPETLCRRKERNTRLAPAFQPPPPLFPILKMGGLLSSLGAYEAELLRCLPDVLKLFSSVQRMHVGNHHI